MGTTCESLWYSKCRKPKLFRKNVKGTSEANAQQPSEAERRSQQIRQLLQSTLRVDSRFLLLLCLCGLCSSSAAHEEEQTAVGFQLDGIPRNDTMLRYLGDFPQMTTFTACFRINLRQYRDANVAISYAVPEDPNEFLIALYEDVQQLELYCCGAFFNRIKFKVALRHWIPLCVGLDLDSLILKILNEGQVDNFDIKVFNHSRLSIRGGGVLVVGQEQDSFGGGFSQLQSLSGTLVDLRLYNHLLADEHLKAFGGCTLEANATTSPLISFSKIKQDFEITNVHIQSIKKEEYCMSQRNEILIFPETRTFKEAKYFCSIAGGTLAVPHSKEAMQMLSNKTAPYNKFCDTGYLDSFWLGVNANVTAQSWNHYLTGEPLNYTNFRDMKQIIAEPLVCVSFVGGNSGYENHVTLWYKAECRFRRCPVCYLDRVVLLKVRGLCKTSLFDRHYFITQDKGDVAFIGTSYSVITRSQPTDGEGEKRCSYGFWELTRLDKPSLRATLKRNSPFHYPLGRNVWSVQNDACGDDNVTILMTSCKTRQFSCSDGQCIDIHQRCNMEIDCPDGSDEMNCQFLTLDVSYNRNNPPPRRNKDTPVHVKIGMYIYAIRNINVANFQVECDIEVVTEWFDSRLQFRHLNFATELNSLISLRYQPWKPKLEFLGHKDVASDVDIRRETLTVLRCAEPQMADDEEEQESEIFAGSENPLFQVQKLTVKIPCEFRLEKFPFDKQICTLGVQMTDITKTYVDLTPKEVVFSGRRRMLEYMLIKELIVVKHLGNYSGIDVLFYLENLSSFYITSTYIPTLIIVVIGYLVFYFPIANFNERIMVGLTGLLVEATFFSQVNSSIPHTAYMKLVDVWMVFCILILFQVVVSVVIIHWLHESWAYGHTVNVAGSTKETRRQSFRGERTRKVNRFFQVITPLIIVLFLVVYTVLANDSSVPI